MGEKYYIFRPEFPERKPRFFRKIPASQGIPNLLKVKKDREAQILQASFWKNCFLHILHGKMFFLLLFLFKSMFLYDSVLLQSFLSGPLFSVAFFGISLIMHILSTILIRY
jgi:hypothetical protein